MKSLSALFLLLGLTVARAEPEGLFEPEVKWDKSRIVVCWKDKPGKQDFTPAEKTGVQSLIQKEFTAARTGIHFVGWKKCSETAGPDIRIETAVKGKPNRTVLGIEMSTVVGQAEIGQGGETGKDDFQARWNRYWGVGAYDGYRRKKLQKGGYEMFLSSERDVKPPGEGPGFGLLITALHEFGHMAGLRHEHARPEAQEDQNCFLYKAEIKDSEPYYTSTWKSSGYDPNSIMNYCWIRLLKSQGTSYFHLRDLNAYKKLNRGPILEAGAKWFAMPNFQDPTIVQLKLNYYAGIDFYQVRVGLSHSDLRAVRCMYRFGGGCQRYIRLAPSFRYQAR